MRKNSRLNLIPKNTRIAELKTLRNHVSACVTSDVVDEDVLRSIDKMINEQYLGMHNHKITYLEKQGLYMTYLDTPDGDKKLYKQVASVSLEKLKQKIVDYYKEHSNKVTIAGLFRMWLEERMRYNEIEKATRDRVESDFRRVFVASGFSGRLVDEITEDELEKWVRTIICDYQLTRKAWGNIRIILSGIFKYAKKKKMTAISISHFLSDLMLSDHMFRRSAKQDWEEVFSDAELEQIINWMLDTRHPERQTSLSNLGILLCVFTGLRAGEIVALKRTDLQGNMLRVGRTQIKHKNDEGGYSYEMRDSTKGRDGWRVIAVPETAGKLFETILKLSIDSEYLFTNPSTGKRMMASTLSEKLVRICKYLEMPLKSLHKIRKTYASILLDAGVSEKIVTAQMGHTDITTTRGFYYKNRHSDAEKIAMVTGALSFPASLLEKKQEDLKNECDID